MSVLKMEIDDLERPLPLCRNEGLEAFLATVVDGFLDQGAISVVDEEKGVGLEDRKTLGRSQGAP